MSEMVNMGFGKVAVGECRCSDTGVPGIIYLPLEQPREHDADCSDVYAAQTMVDPSKVLAGVYFHNLAVVDQTIEVMQDIRKKFTEQV